MTPRWGARPPKRLQAVALGCAAAAFSLLLWSQGMLDRWELATWAWRVQFFARPGPATDKVKLILVDQASLDWGKEENGWSWPWPREVYGPIIDLCRRAGARAVIFDVLYTEPSIYGVPDDAALKAAIAAAPDFVGAMFLGRTGDGGTPAPWPSEIPRRPIVIENLDGWLQGADRDNIVMTEAAFPIPEVGNSAAMLASVAEEPDVDGVFRRATLFRMYGGRVVPSLGLAPFLLRGGPADGSFPLMRIEKGALHIDGESIPIDSSGRAILRYRGPSGVHESFSAAAVIRSDLLLRGGKEPTVKNIGDLKDAYVFLGFTAPGLLDLRPTPVASVYPGVEIYATMLDNLLSNDFLREASTAFVWFAALLTALGSAAGTLYSRRAGGAVGAFLLFLPLSVVAAFAAYGFGWRLPMTPLAGASALALVGGVVVSYSMEGRQKAFLKHAFRHYLSHEVIEEMLRNPAQLQLGGERRELTILFSDLQGFSTFSERLDPQELTALLNDYLSDMTDIIMEEGGTLDKYEGDAIIAFWNAPVEQPDHAARACRAALRCHRRLDERRQEFIERTGVELKARIGINTGPVVVGNMGSRKRFNYTVLGDAANLASRLEGANKAFGTFLMASEYTWRQASDAVMGREIGLLRVVGRKTPVRVFELMGFAGESDCPDPGAFHRGLELCCRQCYAEALAIFESCDGDPVARVYTEKCRDLIDVGDACEWDGVWSLTEK